MLARNYVILKINSICRLINTFANNIKKKQYVSLKVNCCLHDFFTKFILWSTRLKAASVLCSIICASCRWLYRRWNGDEMCSPLKLMPCSFQSIVLETPSNIYCCEWYLKTRIFIEREVRNTFEIVCVYIYIMLVHRHYFKSIYTLPLTRAKTSSQGNTYIHDYIIKEITIFWGLFFVIW